MADSAKGKDPNKPLDSQTPNLKTWVLKASIHCEGCKKKVMKILHNTPGVYSSDVDLKLQKVTVTGNVDVNALISKLIKKTGKHAELWPELRTEQREKKQSKPKPKPKPPLEEKVNAEKVTKEKPKTETSVKKPTEESASGDAQKTQTVKATGAAPGGGGETTESKDEQAKPKSEKKVEKDEACKATKDAEDVKTEKKGEKQSSAVDGGAGDDNVSGNIARKKKKKGQNGKLKLEEEDAAAHELNPHPYVANQSLPSHRPAHKYGPPQSYPAPPVYTVSYNTTPFPASSYGASYYAMPAPHTEAYSYSGSGAEYQPSDIAPYQSQPSDSFQIFSDENPNACSLM